MPEAVMTALAILTAFTLVGCMLAAAFELGYLYGLRVMRRDMDEVQAAFAEHDRQYHPEEAE